MKIDFQKFKTDLSTEQVIEIVESLGGQVDMRQSNREYLIFSSILYHIGDADRHKYKMYYYIDSCSFHDYKLGESFDIYELIIRVKEEYDGVDYNVRNSAFYIAQTLGIALSGKNEVANSNSYNYLADIGRYTKKKEKKVLKTLNSKILDLFEKAYHVNWINDGISIETMKKYNIRFSQWRNSIIIPCYDELFNLIGIRERNVDKTKDWRYMPLTLLDGTECKFQTGQALFGLNINADAIEKVHRVIIFEAEKSVMQCDTMFGNNNISVAIFGSSFQKEQLDKLLSLGVSEIVIALDFDYEKIGDEKWDKFVKKVDRIKSICEPYVDKISVLVEYEPHPSKCSPSDLGKEKFLKLFRNREYVFERK